MVPESDYLTGVKFCFVYTGTPWALLITEIKYLIHTCVKSISFKGITYLIDYGEYNLMKFRMKRTITFTVQFIAVWPDILFGHFYVWCCIELWKLFQQFTGMICPRLMTQHINLRDNPDVIFFACGHDFLDLSL